MSNINQTILDGINVAQGREENKAYLDELGVYEFIEKYAYGLFIHI
jgi:hypothetical protein